MSRPKPPIIAEYINPTTFVAKQVLKAACVYAILFDGGFVNLREISKLKNGGAKYLKSSFSNPGHAFNRAMKLNKMFKTDKFSVLKMTAGEIITEA